MAGGQAGNVTASSTATTRSSVTSSTRSSASFPEELELATRYAWLDGAERERLRAVENERQEITFAANWFISGHNNKLTLDYSYLTIDDAALGMDDKRQPRPPAVGRLLLRELASFTRPRRRHTSCAVSGACELVLGERRADGHVSATL